jgi:spermidine/putrescine transport system ATP-binding protein
LRLRGITPRPVKLGEAATLSIRPEKARLLPLASAGDGSQDEAKPPRAFAMPVKVELVTYIGSDTRMTVRLSDQRTLDVWEQNTRSTLDRDAYWQPGESAVLVCPPDNALVLTE